jgi:hypothetical protein
MTLSESPGGSLVADMDSRNQITLDRVRRNDSTLTHLQLGHHNGGEGFTFDSGLSSEYSQLGAAIGQHTHLIELFYDDDSSQFQSTHKDFFDGLKQNKSIRELSICFDSIGIDGVVHEILKAYQANNSHLALLYLMGTSLQNGGDQVVATTLRTCTNLRTIIIQCRMTDEQLSGMIVAVKDHRLETLGLSENRIGDAGCNTLSTILLDPKCTIETLGLINNNIGNKGAATLANTLLNNKRLEVLRLHGNPLDSSTIEDIFARVLCNKSSSLNSIYSSNHTLQELNLDQRRDEHMLARLLKMNKGTDKSHVAIKKILMYHPNIDMEPLFGWNTEGEGERDLKALPHVIAWFDRATNAVVGDDMQREDLDKGKLYTIYQFARAMPLLFVPTERIARSKIV